MGLYEAGNVPENWKRGRNMWRLIGLAMALAVAGCATAYQSRSLTGGYSETQLGENTFEVSFKGNGYTSPERASDLALLRSAEVAAEHSFPYFIIVSSDNGTQHSAFTTPATTTGSATVVGNTVFGRTTTIGGQTYFISKPSTRNIIVGLTEKPSGFSYDTGFVIRSLRRKYNLQNDSPQADRNSEP
jgi:hypothetical protein